MPIYQVTTKLLGTILVEAEMQGDVFETINKDQITNLVTYLHKEDTSKKKKTTLESELTELLKTDSITLWNINQHSCFCGEYKGRVYTARTIIDVLSNMLQKDIEKIFENLEIINLIYYQLKKFPFGSITLSMKNNDYFKAATQGTWVMDRTIKGVLVNVYTNVLIKQRE